MPPSDSRIRGRQGSGKARRTHPRILREAALSSRRRPPLRRMQMLRRVRVLRRMHMPRRVQMRRRLQTQSRQTPKAPCPTRKFADRGRRLPKGARPPRHDGVPFPARSEAPRQGAASLCDARHRNEIGGDPLLLLKFSCSRSRVAQWQSIRLLIERLLVRVQPREPTHRGEAVRFRPCFA